MKENLTEIVFILDESGSMQPLVADTIGGFNSYVESQKKEPGEAYLTTVLFDDRYEVLHNHVNINDVPPLTDTEYRPCGMTALMDAIGRTIATVGKRLYETPEEERPSHVIFVITTDGMENASREFSRDQVKEMIQHQQDKYSWQFLFLGAGIDAYKEARSIGIGDSHTMSVTADSLGTQNVYCSIANASKVIRGNVCVANSLTDNAWKVGDLGEQEGR